MDSKILGYLCADGCNLAEKTDLNRITCKVCKYIVEGDNYVRYYKCYQCGFISCKECYLKAKDYYEARISQWKPRLDKLKDQKVFCQADHPFDNMVSATTKTICSICYKNPITSFLFICSESCMSVCLNCTSFLLDIQVKKTQNKNIHIRCNAGHLLIKVFRVYSGGCYSCNICYREKNTCSTTEGIYHCYSCGFDICPYCETKLQSCEAEGFYMQNQEKFPMKGSFVIYPNGTIMGFSTDTIGKATWKGTYANGDCILTKKYIGKHKVKYFGKLSDDKIVGTWKVGDANGSFELVFSPTFFSQFSKITLKLEEPIVKGEEVPKVEKQEETSIYLKESVREGDANPTIGSHFNPLPNNINKLDFNCDIQNRRESSCGVDHYQNSIALKPKLITTPALRVSSCFLC